MKDLPATPPSPAGRIKVLYVIFGLAVGGAEMVLLELLRAMDHEQFEVSVLSLAPPAALSD
jgi:hypothetical protein